MFKNVLFLVSLFWLCLDKSVSQKIYDRFTGKPLEQKNLELLSQQNLTGACTIEVAPCTTQEGRRIDGTCNNLEHPSRGSASSPFYRLLPAEFAANNELRRAKDGSELPWVRVIRTSLLSDGLVKYTPYLSSLATHFFVAFSVELGSLTDLLSYVLISDCCTPAGALNPKCIPIYVPEDDPYLSLTDIRCLNMTRHTTFQDLGCAPRTVPLERYSTTTPLIDLSIIYGNVNEDIRRVRAYNGGLIQFEVRNGRIFPPGNVPLCLNNNLQDGETTCNAYGDVFGSNSLLTISLVALFFFREHNRIAQELQKVNPCWNDEKLFTIARQINIAEAQHIYYYELIVAVIGRENALRSGVIGNTLGYINDYDKELEPGTYIEFITGTRYFHALQDGRTNQYDVNGKYQGYRRTTFDEFRNGVFELNDTIEELTQGSIRQPCGFFEGNAVVDRDMAESIFGNRQRAADIFSIDINRGRDLGIKCYNEYRRICGLPVAREWKHFGDYIAKDKIEILSRLYQHPDDVDFMVGVYSEGKVAGAVVGPTLFCVMTRQWVRWRRSDRFFYEHSDQVVSFTPEQLLEIRKSSIARILCDNGDKVTRVQPRAFFHPNPSNEMVSCEYIQKIDLQAWKDSTCELSTKSKLRA